MGGLIFLSFSGVKWGVENIKFSVYIFLSCEKVNRSSSWCHFHLWILCPKSLLLEVLNEKKNILSLICCILLLQSFTVCCSTLDFVYTDPMDFECIFTASTVSLYACKNYYMILLSCESKLILLH